jgi:hypothetical protein
MLCYFFGTGFELGASHLLARCYNPISASRVAGITGVNDCPWYHMLLRVNVTLLPKSWGLRALPFGLGSLGGMPCKKPYTALLRWLRHSPVSPEQPWRSFGQPAAISNHT